MLKQRCNPSKNTGEMFNQQADNSAQKHKKYIKHTIFFLLGLFIGLLLGCILELS